MSGRPSFFSLIAWLPLAAALAAASGAVLCAAPALLLGLGGRLVSPLTEATVASPVSRTLEVHRARAPDARGHRRVA